MTQTLRTGCGATLEWHGTLYRCDLFAPHTEHQARAEPLWHGVPIYWGSTLMDDPIPDDASWGPYDEERERQFQSLMKDEWAYMVPKRLAWRIFSHAYDIAYHKGSTVRTIACTKCGGVYDDPPGHKCALGEAH